MGALALIGIACLAIGWAFGAGRRARSTPIDMVSASGRQLAARRRATERQRQDETTAQLRREVERRQR